MRLFFAFALVAMLPLVGCSFFRKTPPQPDPPVDVSPESLVRLYRDTPHIAHETYSGRRVRVNLPAGSYKIIQQGVGYRIVGWFTGFQDTPPVLVFFCDPPPDEKAALEIVGVCRGRTNDGLRRAPGIDFVITVTECSVLRHGP